MASDYHNRRLSVPIMRRHQQSSWQEYCKNMASVFCFPLLAGMFVCLHAQIAKFMGPTWGPSGTCRPQMGPILAPWTLLSGWYYFYLVCYSILSLCLIRVYFTGAMDIVAYHNYSHYSDISKNIGYCEKGICRVLFDCIIYLECQSVLIH